MGSVFVEHEQHGVIARFSKTSHTYAKPPEHGGLLFQYVAHENPRALRHHWQHFVDRVADWGLDVSFHRPKGVR